MTLDYHELYYTVSDYSFITGISRYSLYDKIKKMKLIIYSFKIKYILRAILYMTFSEFLKNIEKTVLL